MSDEALKRVQAMWPRPRVGQQVRTRSGRVGEVITVAKARDIIRSKSEVEAMMMAPRLQASFGKHWLDVYYEADVVFSGRLGIQRVSALDVEEVLEPD